MPRIAPPEIDIDHPPRRSVLLVDEAAHLHDPRVVDQYLQRAELLLGAVQERGEGGPVGDVERQRHGTGADLCGGMPRGGQVEIADRNPHARAGEHARGRATDAACASGDSDGLSSQYPKLPCHMSLLERAGL